MNASPQKPEINRKRSRPSSPVSKRTPTSIPSRMTGTERMMIWTKSAAIIPTTSGNRRTGLISMRSK